jgi:hypothetical protein
MAFERLENIITAEAVARKWEMDSWLLGETTRKDRIYVYHLEDTRQLPDGKKVYLCDGPYAQGMPYEEDFGKRIYNLSSYVFKREDIEEYEATHPEYLLPRAHESEPEYIPADNLRKEMNLSPVQFVDYLRKNRDLYAMGPTMDEGDTRLWFYKESSRGAAAQELEHIYFHRLDVETHKKRMEEESSFMADVPFGDDFSELKAQLAEAQKKVEDVEGVRRWNKQFLAERAELRNYLAEKDSRIAELEKELAAVKARLENDKGLSAVVCRMRRGGKTDEEIAFFLSDGGGWCSDAQVGALLHHDENRVASSSMQQRARRLLGKA